jgi:hypothetical protein
MDAEQLVVKELFNKIDHAPPEDKLADKGVTREHRLLMRSRTP